MVSCLRCDQTGLYIYMNAAPTDGQTDTPSFRGARMHLKILNEYGMCADRFCKIKSRLKKDQRIVAVSRRLHCRVASSLLNSNKAVYMVYVAPRRPKSESITIYGRIDRPTVASVRHTLLWSRFVATKNHRVI